MDLTAWLVDMGALCRIRSDGVTAFFSMAELLVAESIMVTERLLLWLLLAVGALPPLSLSLFTSASSFFLNSIEVDYLMIDEVGILLFLGRAT